MVKDGFLGIGIDGRPGDVGKNYSSELMPVISDHFKNKFGMKGMRDYWIGLERNQKISALVMGATVTSIVLGAAFLIKENEKIQATFDKMAKRKKEESQNER